MKEKIAIVGKKEISQTPLLIAKDRNAKFLKDDYKIGWYQRENNSDKWLWTVFGSCPDLDSAIKCASDVIKEKGERAVYLSDRPLRRALIVQEEKLELIQLY